MERAVSAEKFRHIHETTWRNISRDGNLKVSVVSAKQLESPYLIVWVLITCIVTTHAFYLL
jgi:hypothetical protein